MFATAGIECAATLSRKGRGEERGAPFSALSKFERVRAIAVSPSAHQHATVLGCVKGKPAAPILHIVGLFDRPAEREALEALLAEPAIPGLTEAFHELSPAPCKARWNVAVERLRKLKLLLTEDRHQPGALNTHPLVRAHFGDRLKSLALSAYKEAHSRLYDFYRFYNLPEEFRTSSAYLLLELVAPDPRAKGMIAARIDRTARDNQRFGELKKATMLLNTKAFEKYISIFPPRNLEYMQ